MQTEVPTLPVVQINAQKNLNRKENSDLKKSSVEIKAPSPNKTTGCFSSNKKCLHPLLGGPYRSNTKQHAIPEHLQINKTSIGQRVLSAKMLRLKQLQNQLADAHYHLNELANENRLLKALQKRQDSALKRYEGANAELPRIINSHHEELRVLQAKYKKLKALHKETCDQLKEKESEIQYLQSQNKHLLQLSKDRNLLEREKLQLQVSDLNHRIEQQQETIQRLHRKLTLEGKSLRHQLQTEISKRKEAQKSLQEVTDKLRSLENFLDNRERRLHYNGQLPISNKGGRFGTQSLTNLRDISALNPSKLSTVDKKWQKDVQKDSLPLLDASESNGENNESAAIKGEIPTNPIPESFQTETMANLQQIRKYRLQNSSQIQRSSHSLDNFEQNIKASFKMGGNSKDEIGAEDSETSSTTRSEDAAQQHEMDAATFKKLYENGKYNNFNDQKVELEVDPDYLSEAIEIRHEYSSFKDDFACNTSKKSRELHARLINSTDNIPNATEDISIHAHAQDNHGKQFESLFINDLLLSNRKSKNNINLSERQVEKHFCESDSEIEPALKTIMSIDCLYEENDNRNLKLISSKYDAKCYLPPEENLDPSAGSEIRRTCHEAVGDVPNKPQETNNCAEENEGHDLKSDVEFYIKQDGGTASADSNEDSSKPIQLGEQKLLDKPANITDFENTQLSPIHRQNQKHADISFGTDEGVRNSALASQSGISTTNDGFLEKSPRQGDKAAYMSAHVEHCGERRLSSVMDNPNDDTISWKLPSTNVDTSDMLKQVKLSVEVETVKALCDNTQYTPQQTGTDHGIVKAGSTNKAGGKVKTINYNKEKLLATMRAIDNNENVEFFNQAYQKHNTLNRKQITDNLFHGLPSQTRKKHDVLKDIFSTDSIENKPREDYSKLH